VDSPREQRRVDYWLERTGSSRAELAAILDELGAVLPPKARALPQGALRRLRRRYEFTPAVAKGAEQATLIPPCPPLAWETIGQPRQVVYLSEQDALDVHKALVKDFAEADDPIDPPGTAVRAALGLSGSPPDHQHRVSVEVPDGGNGRSGPAAFTCSESPLPQRQ
jgi:hypothetical protein